jgi:hypothetical protein
MVPVKGKTRFGIANALVGFKPIENQWGVSSPVVTIKIDVNSRLWMTIDAGQRLTVVDLQNLSQTMSNIFSYVNGASLIK